MRQRITVTLSDNAHMLVLEYAKSRGVSTSRAVSVLIELSAERKPRIRMANGLAVFDVDLKGGTITTEQVLQLEEESW